MKCFICHLKERLSVLQMGILIVDVKNANTTGIRRWFRRYHLEQIAHRNYPIIYIITVREIVKIKLYLTLPTPPSLGTRFDDPEQALKT